LLSRRQAGLLLLAAPVAAALVYRMLPAAAPDPEEQLRAALAGMELPFAPARMELVRFARTQEAGDVRLDAVVALHWAPGTRRRGFSVRAGDPRTALPELIAAVRDTFSAAV
jgi:hypothetical protein